MPQELNAFGTEKPGITLSASNSTEVNARIWAEHYNNAIKPGHGLFFDFSATPEFEKPALNELQKLGWILEKPFFIRKQDIQNN